MRIVRRYASTRRPPRRGLNASHANRQALVIIVAPDGARRDQRGREQQSRPRGPGEHINGGPR
jgi:hypothetical protein